MTFDSSSGEQTRADSELQPGHPVGEYEVTGCIGRGGFGSVYRAVHPLIGKVVAIKVLHRRYSSQPQMVARFVDEARAVNQIRHRNIIDIFGFGRLDDGRHYYVMEYLDGVSLEDYLAAFERLDLARTIQIARPIGKALAAAHEQGIFHRDLKAENVFLATDHDGMIEPKLLDFGIAKLMGESARSGHRTRTGESMGTPAYMSPEQSLGERVDHRTDVYSFGILVYRMLAGRLPFDDENYLRILLKQVNEPPRPMSSVVPDLPVSIDVWAAWVLAKEADARPPDMATAMAALEEVATREGMAVPGNTSSGIFLELPERTENEHATSANGSAHRRREPPRVSLDVASSPTIGLIDDGDNPAAAGDDGDIALAVTGRAAPVSPHVERAQTVDLDHADVAGSGVGRRDTLDPTAEVRSRRGSLRYAIAAVGLAVVASVVYGVVAQGGGGEVATLETTDPAMGVARAEHREPSDRDALARERPDRAIAERETPDAAPERSTVELAIDGLPRGAQVRGPGGLLGAAPGPFRLTREDGAVEITIEAAGYRTLERTIMPTHDQRIQVSLRKRSGNERRRDRRRPAPAPRRDDPDDPNALASPFDRTAGPPGSIDR